ncbi:MAG: histidine--tRNA ligase [Treponemataceae bacterium]
MENLIQPRLLKGFRDFLPEDEIQRSVLEEKLTYAFRSYGFVPIDTPALEYSEILLRKSNGETEKQVFRFDDNGGRDVSLRFDLTVPFARFVAEHKDVLYFPFKRYHIAKVWRGEKPQAGRYREFVQCDFDMVGTDSSASDFEILSLMKYALNAIGIKNFTIRMNHRGIFNAFLAKLELFQKSEDILRIVDKLAKIGTNEVVKLLDEVTQSSEKSSDILKFIGGDKDFDSTLNLMAQMAGKEAESAVCRMKEIYQMMKDCGIDSVYVLDPSITRGLDYYTGVVYETFLNDLPSIGSICSGGRYDNLAGLYMKDKISGVGSSIGLDRLIAAMEQLELSNKRKSFVDVEIFCQSENLKTEYQVLACKFRSLGVSAEVFPDVKKIAQQYAVTDRKGINWGILMTDEDYKDKKFILKNLVTRQQYEISSVEDAVKKIINS